MKKLSQSLTIILAAVVLTLTAGAEVSKEQETGIRKMMRVTGMISMLQEMSDQMLTGIKQGAPAGVPAEFWTQARDRRIKIEDLIQRMIPVYAKYCTVEDLKAINAFYESPAGHRFVTNLSPMMQECMKIGQDWGQDTSQKIIDDLKAEVAKQGKPAGITVPGIGK